MADIRNDQYLHRPGAGRGAITPADPLEVLLYDGSGNPLLVKTPTGETRQALGVAGYGYDGTNWRPVKVNASGQAEVQLTGQIEVLYEGPISTITAGSSVAVVPKRPTEFKEVRGGIAVSSANRGDWQLYVLHLHDAGGNYFGSEDLVRLTDDMVGGGGAKNLLSSHFEVRVLNNNSFDAAVYRVSILGVR